MTILADSLISPNMIFYVRILSEGYVAFQPYCNQNIFWSDLTLGLILNLRYYVDTYECSCFKNISMLSTLWRRRK